MAVITKICVQVKDPERCNIYLDGEFAFAVAMETVYLKRLKKGDELSESDVRELSMEGEKSKALSKTVDYVSRMPKTKKQVKDYLAKKGYSGNVVYYVVETLEKYGYINDKTYAKRFIESNYKTCGEKMLVYKLITKGVARSVIEEALDETEVGFKASAVTVAKKYMRNKPVDKQNLAKLYRYLSGKGFSYEDISVAVDEIKSNADDAEEFD